ncbi:acyl-protein thioesterase 1,2, putative [Talaromyces stipitatus ATCC 10500]|uniref:Acyl-protein thioesterase 1 n=1 Tax=Talaromyces stipitatus (strain ATCC 10500 / CBS 375.48 / QM 6759 / NRRL 1006) TaxID=441959 RepID=B8M766_TALSN|nr:acyl-protein thioesterase 1,2, putative [Talaromyces stipitatus ATCC 10500]EED20286.1 acyl-protein thioesterase 1,2, putative [Talaromyces stipitatus ATCC 10500]
MHKQGKKNPYPIPFCVEPLRPQHTHTFIILHGRGSNAEKFGRELLASANLPARLPTVKFVFPTASKRRSTVLKKMPINQWFDNYSLDDPNQRTDLQADGLMETAKFLRELVDAEARVLDNGAGETGHKRIIIGGLSQGCAAAIFTLLGGGFGESGNERPGAFFGMSGWLPFEKQLNSMMNVQGMSSDRVHETEEEDEEEDDSESSDDDDDRSESDVGINVSFNDTASDNFASDAEVNLASFDPFQRDPQDNPENNIADALNSVRDILDLPPVVIGLSAPDDDDNETTHEVTTEAFPILQTPIFLGHGSADSKVSVRLGEKMAELLSKKMKIDVTWKTYDGFGHWYKVPDEIDDILEFLQQNINLPVEMIWSIFEYNYTATFDKDLSLVLILPITLTVTHIDLDPCFSDGTVV